MLSPMAVGLVGLLLTQMSNSQIMVDAHPFFLNPSWLEDRRRIAKPNLLNLLIFIKFVVFFFH